MPPWRTAASRTASAKRAAARKESRRCVIGVEPACAAWPRKITRLRSTPTVPSTVPTGRPEALEHRPLLDVQLEVGAHVAQPRARLVRAVEVDAVRCHAHPRAARRSRRAGRARRRDRASRRRRRSRTGCARSARPPRRPSRRASPCTAACPASASERSVSSAPMTPSAPSSQPPFGTESMCEPITTVSGRAPARRAQRLPASSTSTSTGSSARRLAQQPARVLPLVRPAQPARAARAAGQLGQRAQIGDRPLRLTGDLHRASPRAAG